MEYTIENIEAIARSALNEYSVETITSTEVLNIINFGYKDIATRSLCIEHDTGVVTTIGTNFIKFPSWRKINYVELIRIDNSVIFQDTIDIIFQDTDDVTFFKTELVSIFPRRSIPMVLPSVIGWKGLNGDQPQYWFQWGNYLYIEPVPLVRYLLILYYSETPTYQIISGTPSELPTEFMPCLIKFVTAMMCIKLKRWKDVANYYNQYIVSLQMSKAQYLKKYADQRMSHIMPDNMVVKNG